MKKYTKKLNDEKTKTIFNKMIKRIGFIEEIYSDEGCEIEKDMKMKFEETFDNINSINAYTIGKSKLRKMWIAIDHGHPDSLVDHVLYFKGARKPSAKEVNDLNILLSFVKKLCEKTKEEQLKKVIYKCPCCGQEMNFFETYGSLDEKINLVYKPHLGCTMNILKKNKNYISPTNELMKLFDQPTKL